MTDKTRLVRIPSGISIKVLSVDKQETTKAKKRNIAQIQTSPRFQITNAVPPQPAMKKTIILPPSMKITQPGQYIIRLAQPTPPQQQIMPQIPNNFVINQNTIPTSLPNIVPQVSPNQIVLDPHRPHQLSSLKIVQPTKKIFSIGGTNIRSMLPLRDARIQELPAYIVVEVIFIKKDIKGKQEFRLLSSNDNKLQYDDKRDIKKIASNGNQSIDVIDPVKSGNSSQVISAFKKYLHSSDTKSNWETLDRCIDNVINNNDDYNPPQKKKIYYGDNFIEFKLDKMVSYRSTGIQCELIKPEDVVKSPTIKENKEINTQNDKEKKEDDDFESYFHREISPEEMGYKHTKSGRVKCLKCGVTRQNTGNIYQHLQTHNQSATLCMFCGKNFMHWKARALHEYAHHHGKKLKPGGKRKKFCSYKKYWLGAKSVSKKYQTMVLTSISNHTEKHQITESKLSTNVKILDAGTTENDTSGPTKTKITGVIPFKCDICQMKFVARSKLNAHRQIVHFPTKKRTFKTFHCTVCNASDHLKKRFVRHFRTRKHMDAEKEWRTKTQIEFHECSNCADTVFYEFIDLYEHMLNKHNIQILPNIDTFFTLDKDSGKLKYRLLRNSFLRRLKTIKPPVTATSSNIIEQRREILVVPYTVPTENDSEPSCLYNETDFPIIKREEVIHKYSTDLPVTLNNDDIIYDPLGYTSDNSENYDDQVYNNVDCDQVIEHEIPYEFEIQEIDPDEFQSEK